MKLLNFSQNWCNSCNVDAMWRLSKAIHLLSGEHGEILERLEVGWEKVACWSTKAAVFLKRVSDTVHCGAQGRLRRGLKLYHRVLGRALPVHFFRHFCCGMYRLATTHSEKPNRRNFRVWNSYGIFGVSILQASPCSGFLGIVVAERYGAVCTWNFLSHYAININEESYAVEHWHFTRYCSNTFEARW